MKCPKCDYLGFETADRCRNCGYDFSLAVAAAPDPELPLRDASPGSPLLDFDLRQGGGTPASDSLDLDRLIGAEGNEERRPKHEERRTTNEERGTKHRERPALPLFKSRGDSDELPLIPPRPARPPLAVRRAAPEVPRGRSRTPRPTPRDEPSLTLQVNGEPEPAAIAVPSDSPRAPDTAASGGARLGAAIVDTALLAGIDVTVLYLTLAIAGLAFDEIGVLPPVPMIAFLLLMNGGYLMAFTAAGGQTIGKMLAGIRVTASDGERVSVPSACLRALGCGLSLLSAGMGYLPAFVAADGRALHDRLAGTRVVEAE